MNLLEISVECLFLVGIPVECLFLVGISVECFQLGSVLNVSNWELFFLNVFFFFFIIRTSVFANKQGHGRICHTRYIFIVSHISDKVHSFSKCSKVFQTVNTIAEFLQYSLFLMSCLQHQIMQMHTNTTDVPTLFAKFKQKFNWKRDVLCKVRSALYYYCCSLFGLYFHTVRQINLYIFSTLMCQRVYRKLDCKHY